jgi:hypothetical protein
MLLYVAQFAISEPVVAAFREGVLGIFGRSFLNFLKQEETRRCHMLFLASGLG